MAKSNPITTRSPSLNDLQRVLLSTASQRADGNLLPVADSIAGKSDAVRRAIPALLKRSLAEEVEVTSAGQVWREADENRLGVAITEAGRAAIDGACTDNDLNDASGGDSSAAAPAAQPVDRPTAPQVAVPRASSKAAQVILLLQREEGATLAELVEATGWLPHTTRAALTGLRKNGHAIEKGKRDEVTCYRIAQVA